MYHPNQSPHRAGAVHGPLASVPKPAPLPAIPDHQRPSETFVASVDGHLLFEQLSADELARLDAVSSIWVCQEGETIYQAGAPASNIYVNLKGAVYLMMAGQAPGDQPLLSEVLAGEIFGVSSVVGNRRYTTDAVAANACRVLSMDAQRFGQLLRSNPLAGMSFAQGVARVYMDRYLDLMRHL